MVASAIFITDHNGKALISRNYRGDVSSHVTKEFEKILMENTMDHECKPMICCPIDQNDITFCFVKHNDLHLLGVSKTNSNVMVIVNFLHKMVQVFEDYFGELDQESIRDNFVLIYELLDEMCDFGFPQHTQSNLLKEYICIKNNSNTINTFKKIKRENKEPNIKAIPTIGMLTGPYCTSGLNRRKYKKNEVFVDVIEKIDCLVSPNGIILDSQILGTIKMKAYLSGMPEIKIGLNDKILMQRKRHRKRNRSKTVAIDDIKLHPCVRLSRFEKEGTIEFIPPDGTEFELMSYRLSGDGSSSRSSSSGTYNTSTKPIIFVECYKNIQEYSRIEYNVKIKNNLTSNMTARQVKILIPVPNDIDSPKFIHKIGKCNYIPENNYIEWSIKQLAGQRNFNLKASVRLPTVSAYDAGQERDNKLLTNKRENGDTRLMTGIGIGRKQPIKVEFEVPHLARSGLRVRYCKILERSGYEALPWIRYLTQAGNYAVRM